MAITDAVQFDAHAAIQGGLVNRFPTAEQRQYLERGLAQPGGKLPLFDRQGRPVHPSLVRSCLSQGWAEPWFVNPLKPDWLVCKLTDKGRRAISE